MAKVRVKSVQVLGRFNDKMTAGNSDELERKAFRRGETVTNLQIACACISVHSGNTGPRDPANALPLAKDYDLTVWLSQ